MDYHFMIEFLEVNEKNSLVYSKTSGYNSD